MSKLKRQIVKITCLFLVIACASLAVHRVWNTHTASAAHSQQSAKRPHAEAYGRPVIVGSLKNRAIVESSGLTASRISPGVYWTHNDSGDGPYIYALNSRGGSLGVWRVAGAAARDWEDIASGPGPDANKSYLYIGDIGDNGETRPDVVIYRVPEPTINPETVSSAKIKPLTTEPAEAFRFRYPDGKHDAEALLVHPQTGEIYIVTKVLLDKPGVYKIEAPLTAGLTKTMRRIGTLNIPSLLGGFITGGSVSPDGRRVALCDYLQGYELTLPPHSSLLEAIWSQPIVTIDLGRRSQGEGIAYRSDGMALLATSEGRYAPLIQVVRKNQ